MFILCIYAAFISILLSLPKRRRSGESKAHLLEDSLTNQETRQEKMLRSVFAVNWFANSDERSIWMTDLGTSPPSSFIPAYHQKEALRNEFSGNCRRGQIAFGCNNNNNFHPPSIRRRSAPPRGKLIFESAQSLMRYLFIDGWYVINIAKRGPRYWWVFSLGYMAMGSGLLSVCSEDLQL